MSLTFFFHEKLLPYVGKRKINSEKWGIAWVLAKDLWLIGAIRQRHFHTNCKNKPRLWSGDTQLVWAGTHGGVLSSPESE